MCSTNYGTYNLINGVNLYIKGNLFIFIEH